MYDDNKTVLITTPEAQESLTKFKPHQPISSMPKISKAYQDLFADRMNADDVNMYLLLAKPMFKHINNLLDTYEVQNVTEIFNHLHTECETFVSKCKQNNLDESHIMIARYIMCTYIDELISTTYWGKEHGWAEKSLLNSFYKETYGGEKFFKLLATMLQTPSKNINILELMYFCIALGFEGKYRISQNGKMELEAIKDNLYKQIKSFYGREIVKFYLPPTPSTTKNKYFYKISYTSIAIGVFLTFLVVLYFLRTPLIEDENRILSILNSEISKYQPSITMKNIDANLTLEQKGK